MTVTMMHNLDEEKRETRKSKACRNASLKDERLERMDDHPLHLFATIILLTV